MARDLFEEAGIAPPQQSSARAPRDLFAEAGIGVAGQFDPAATVAKIRALPVSQQQKAFGAAMRQLDEDSRAAVVELMMQTQPGEEQASALQPSAPPQSTPTSTSRYSTVPNNPEARRRAAFAAATHYPATLQFGPWDTGVAISPEVNALISRAGGAALGGVDGIKSLFGFGDTPQEREERKLANSALDQEYRKSALAGNLLANAGMMYTGGKSLSMAGNLLSKAAPAVGDAVSAAGRAMYSPTSAKDAMVGGALYGGLISPEDRKEEALVGAGGGLLGYGVGKAAGSLLGTAAEKTKNFLLRHKPVSAIELDKFVTNSLGVNPAQYQEMSGQAQDALRNMAKEAMAHNPNVTPEMAQRLADFNASGVNQPLRGWVSREPMDWVKAHELQGVAPDVTQRWAGANQAFVSKVDGMAPQMSDYSIGKKFSGQIAGKADALGKGVDDAYKTFRGIAGRDVPLDPIKFNNELGMELQIEQLGGDIPASTQSWLNDIATGKQPFNFHTASQAEKVVNKRIVNSSNGSEKAALGLVKRHLMAAMTGADDPITDAVGGGAKAEELNAAWNVAKGLAKERFGYLEASPLHEMVTNGKLTAENLPDMFGRISVDDLKSVAAADAKYGTTSIADLRDAAAAYIRDSATLQSETGGKFTQAGLRRALEKIGPDKGKMLFGNQWDDYQSVLRAGGAMMNQPAGVIAANSGTGQMIARMANAMPSVPFASKGLSLLPQAMRAGKRAMDVNGQLYGSPYQRPGLLSSSWEDFRTGDPGALGLLGYIGATSSTTNR